MKSNIYLSLMLLSFFLLNASMVSMAQKQVVSGQIVYEKHEIISQEAADKINNDFKNGIEWMSRTLDSSKNTDFVNGEQHHDMMITAKHDRVKLVLKIFPEYYWQPIESKTGSFKDYGKYTHRDSAYQCLKSESKINKKCDFTKRELQYANEIDYKIDYFYEDKKDILGFPCFKIIIEHLREPLYNIELYATQSFALNYNPISNFKSINEIFFVMEMIKVGYNGVRNEFKIKSINLNY